MSDRLAALIGVLPPFLMLWYAERFERRIKEPHRDWRYRVLVAAGLGCVPIAWAERLVSNVTATTPEPQRSLFEAFIVAATIEEAGKVLCLYLLTRVTLSPGTRYNAFLYALHAATGFAIVENVLIMLDAPNLRVFTVRFVLRAYMASPMHLFAGGVVGYVWARRRFDNGAVGLSGGLACAIAIHGSYNALLYGVERLPDHMPGAVIACALAAMAVPLVGLVTLRVFAERLRTDDQRDGRNAHPSPVEPGQAVPEPNPTKL
jgi:RsiW-degrading membrane proteinase PrsW (M82 family)